MATSAPNGYWTVSEHLRTHLPEPAKRGLQNDKDFTCINLYILSSSRLTAKKKIKRGDKGKPHLMLVISENMLFCVITVKGGQISAIACLTEPNNAYISAESKYPFPLFQPAPSLLLYFLLQLKTLNQMNSLTEVCKLLITHRQYRSARFALAAVGMRQRWLVNSLWRPRNEIKQLASYRSSYLLPRSLFMKLPERSKLDRFNSQDRTDTQLH